MTEQPTARRAAVTINDLFLYRVVDEVALVVIILVSLIRQELGGLLRGRDAHLAKLHRSDWSCRGLERCASNLPDAAPAYSARSGSPCSRLLRGSHPSPPSTSWYPAPEATLRIRVGERALLDPVSSRCRLPAQPRKTRIASLHPIWKIVWIFARLSFL